MKKIYQNIEISYTYCTREKDHQHSKKKTINVIVTGKTKTKHEEGNNELA